MSAQQKWLYKLLGFDFNNWVQVRDNVVANDLSTWDGMGEKQWGLATISHPIPNLAKVIRDEVFSNFELHELKDKIDSGEAVGPWKFIDGLILFKDRTYLPQDSKFIFNLLSKFY